MTEPTTLEGWEAWCSMIPKVELHAHLNGCIRPSTLCELATAQFGSTEHATMIMSHIDLISRNEASLALGFKLFDMIYQVTNTLEIIARITRETIEDCAKDNVKYLELRTTPRAIPSTPMTKRTYIETVLSTIQNVTLKHDITVGLIISINRNETSEAAMETVQLAVEYKSQGIVGIDLSGNPTVGDFETFVPALEYARNNGLKLTIHFAEVYKPAESKAMLDFLPNRLGHACYLNPDLHRLILESKIPIEICLTSNVITKSVSEYKTHHFQQFFASGHPISICTDDYGIFSTTLSREYALIAWHFKLTIKDIFTLVLSTVDQIFTESEILRKQIRDKIENFFTQQNILQN